MFPTARNHPEFAARLSFLMLAGFLCLLWLSGGASRADVVGQAVVRFFAWTLLIVFILLSPRVDWHRIRLGLIFVGCAALLAAVQLVPLPPTIWKALPGREPFVLAADVIGQPQPWRPMSISPSLTINALGSLAIPATVLVFAANLKQEQHHRLLGLLLTLCCLSAMVGLLQFSGATINNPFVNDIAGSVSGNFANRNHFALFVAFGCILGPVWASRGERRARWRWIVGVGTLPVFILVIMASGSRMGLLVGILGLCAGLAIARREAVRDWRMLPKFIGIALLAVLAAIFLSAIALSVYLDRAEAVTRAIEFDLMGDMRARATPVVLAATGQFLPFGSGFGTFDPVFRMAEPDALLQLRYYNHAHNDWLEVVLEGGLAAAVLLLAALIWWGRKSLRVWFRDSSDDPLARVASAMILLVFLASASDYPARTPLIMAAVALASMWLAKRGSQRRKASPPRSFTSQLTDPIAPPATPPL